MVSIEELEDKRSKRAAMERGTGDPIQLYDEFVDIYDPYRGTVRAIPYGLAVQEGWLPRDIRTGADGDRIGFWSDRLQDNIMRQFQEDLLSQSRGGGGGGGGSAGPTYVKPDTDTVREQVKAYVVATIGSYDEPLIDEAVNKFLAADKQAFDRRDVQEVNPWNAVQSVVRNNAKYKSVHRLRPESVDEMQWVTSRQAMLRDLGVDAARAEDLGAAQAQAGGSNQDLVAAANISSATHKEVGRAQRQGLTQAAYNVARMIK